MLAPEIFAKKVADSNPAIMSAFDNMQLNRDSIARSGKWPEWAALPGNAIVGGMEAAIKSSLPRDLSLAPHAVEAYLWLKSKQIFAFDETLEKELIAQEFSGDIPGEVLYRMPVPCVYVQLHADSRIFSADTITDGFFAWMEFDPNMNAPFLSVTALTAEGTLQAAIMCHMLGTIEESLNAFTSHASKVMKDPRVKGSDLERLMSRSLNSAAMARDAEILKKVFNLLLYLCTDEPDYDNQPRRVKAKPTYTTYTPERPPCRTNITNVGTRIGAAIRLDRQKAKELNDEAEQQSEHRKHASPIAHIRRGHYHSFWTGAKESVDRKIVVKWLPPMLINGDKGEISPTIRPVK